MNKNFYHYYFIIGGGVIVGLLLFSQVIPVFVITTPIGDSRVEEINGSVSLSTRWGGDIVYKLLDANGKALGWGSKIVVQMTSTGSIGVQISLVNSPNSRPGISSRETNFEKTFEINHRDIWYLLVGFGYWGFPENYDFEKDSPFFLGTPISTTVSYTIEYVINNTNEAAFYLLLGLMCLIYIVIPVIIYKKYDKGSLQVNEADKKDFERNFLFNSQITVCHNCGQRRENTDVFCNQEFRE